jgi:uncharacterized protein
VTNPASALSLRTLLARAALALCALMFVPAALAVDVPFLSGRVVDNAEILKPATRERVTAALKAREDKSGDQIAVLTVPTIGGDSVEEYATKVFENWKLGQKGKDNGVLVVVVPNDHKMRIEVGYGLEGTLTDVAAARIIRNVMTPAFKAGDYDKGVEDGVAAVVATLEGNAGVAPDPVVASVGRFKMVQTGGEPISWQMKILLGVFVFGIIGLFTFIGIMTPGMGWFLYVFLIPFWAMFPLIIIGGTPTLVVLATYLVGYPLAKLILARQPWYQKAAADLKSKGKANIGGFVVSSSGGSSSSGWSSGGGGGFSGGGGSSGGGGASGSW